MINNLINNIQFAQVNLVTFETSGTYTPPANLLFAQVECQGAGGGGGGAITAGGTAINAGAGGGAGEYCMSILSRATIGPSQTVSVGAAGAGGAAGTNSGLAGGNTSFGALIVSNGGTAGGGAVAGNSAGAEGGNTSVGIGTFKIRGSSGLGGFKGINIEFPTGASSQLGRGGRTVIDAPGVPGLGYGSGGGGGATLGSGASQPGGDGAPGIVIITEYLSA